jgi:hypothetical protein
MQCHLKRGICCLGGDSWSWGEVHIFIHCR